MTKLKKIFFFFIFLVVLSCKGGRDPKIVDCKKLKCIDILPDSSFMSNALKMQFTDNSIFFIEKNSRNLIKLQSDFTESKKIANRGMGPQEVLDPRNFIIFNDTIYIMDIGSMSIKSYTQSNNFIRSFKTNVLSEQRIFMKNQSIYLAAYNRKLKTPLARININNDMEVVKYWGEPLEFGHPLQNMIRNKRDLLDDGNYYYCISDNRPLIEKYDFVNESLLQSFDYSDIPMIEDNLKIIKNKFQGENTYTAFVRDSYIYGENIYLLISQQGDNFSANKIMKINLIPELKVEKIYLLPDRTYSTFCIGNDFMFAFNNGTTDIEKIGL